MVLTYTAACSIHINTLNGYTEFKIRQTEYINTLIN